MGTCRERNKSASSAENMPPAMSSACRTAERHGPALRRRDVHEERPPCRGAEIPRPPAEDEEQRRNPQHMDDPG